MTLRVSIYFPVHRSFSAHTGVPVIRNTVLKLSPYSQTSFDSPILSQTYRNRPRAPQHKDLITKMYPGLQFQDPDPGVEDGHMRRTHSSAPVALVCFLSPYWL